MALARRFTWRISFV